MSRQLTDSSRCCLTLTVAGMLLSAAINNLEDKSFFHFARMGLGAVNAESMTDSIFGSSRKLLQGIAILLPTLVANSPQPLVSFLFLTYNSLYTCMFIVHEWFDYGSQRKHLRVTDPTGYQPSTYRLQLPYKYGVPLPDLSGILHWLVSQSIFLVVVERYDGNDHFSDYGSTIVIGYSCIAILTTIILGSITVLTGIFMVFRRYSGDMPLAGSCSAAISAACHQPSDYYNAAGKPLLWGVPESSETPSSDVDSTTDSGVGHCCFTSLPALLPKEGHFYTGK